MGHVYLAEQAEVGRQVVIKVLHPELTAGSPAAKQRFEREAMAAARLSHPNIVQVHQFGTSEDGQRFLVMEYVEGPTLLDIMGERLDPRRALSLSVQVCRALEAAHARGVVHRDLKPENIMLSVRADAGETVKVVDFGLASIPDAERLTQTGEIFGTPRYMAPEQSSGQAVDGRADLYSLAVILHEMLTGAHPFEARSPLDFLMKHASAPFRLPGERFKDLQLSPDVDALLARALAKSPEERFQDARAMRGALETLLAGDPTARPTRTWWWVPALAIGAAAAWMLLPESALRPASDAATARASAAERPADASRPPDAVKPSDASRPPDARPVDARPPPPEAAAIAAPEPPKPSKTKGPQHELGVELPPGAKVFLRMGAISKARVRAPVGPVFDHFERRYGKLRGVMFKRTDATPDLTVILTKGELEWRMLKVTADDRPGHLTITIFRR